MKKKIWIVALAVVIMAAFFAPIPQSPSRDGGTREYTALTYKIVDWNRLTDDGVYDATRVYWLPDNFKTIDELWAYEEPYVVHSFVATVLELGGTSALVQPVTGEIELGSSDRISIGITDLRDIDAQVGSEVEIFYTGGIMESYPAQVNAITWTLANDLRHREYAGQWLDKETAEKCDYEPFDHIVITRIYSNCFFATPAIPMPWEIKLNGQLGEEWCVGDQITCTYQNVYRDNDTMRFEADFTDVKASDWQPEPGVAYKPVIYLYPEREMDVSVRLALNGKLTCTYPAYNDGWNVTATPDGMLTDAQGQTYNYLYWEGQTNARWDMTEGFCVKGEDTATFLEDALAKLGLTRREANEFIVYWLPLMQESPYNIISFQTDVYENAAKLDISPVPDALIRVFMAWQPAEAYVAIQPQTLTTPERTGFTAVEWGGTQLP